MKTIISLCLVLMLVLPLQAAYLSFEMSQPEAEYITLRYESPKQVNPIINRIKLVANKKKTSLIDIQEPTFLDIEYGKIHFQVILHPDQQLSFTFDDTNALSNTKVEGDSNNENKVFLQFQAAFRDSEMVEEKIGLFNLKFLAEDKAKAQEMSADDYMKFLAETLVAEQEFLHQNPSSPMIEAYLSQESRYYHETRKMTYALTNRTTITIHDVLAMTTEYQVLLPSFQLYEDQVLPSPHYKNYLRTFVSYVYLPNSFYAKSLAHSWYELIDNNLEGESKAYLLAHLFIKNYQLTGDVSLAKSKFQQFKSQYPGNHVSRVEEVYGSELSVLPQALAPDVIGEDSFGREIKLSDYKGKVVYISYWASWCKPCLKNFDKSVALRQKLENIGVVLLNISIDKSEEAWKKTLTQHNLVGVNIHAKDINQTKLDYDLTALPAYFIINKKGEFDYLSEEEGRNIEAEFKRIQAK